MKTILNKTEPQNLYDLIRFPTSHVVTPEAPKMCIHKPSMTNYNISVNFMDFSYSGDIRLLKQTLRRLKKNLNPLLKDTVKNIAEVTNGFVETAEEQRETLNLEPEEEVLEGYL